MAKPSKQKRTSRSAPPPTMSDVPSRCELLRRAHSWSSQLLDGPVVYYPVRHHSPACAKHLAKLIDELEPATIIVEGPCSMNRWISALQSPECIGPVAVLHSFRESESLEPPRHSGLYPLCDYSPEWVAIRKAKEKGARIRFADMEFADKVRYLQQNQAGRQTPNRSWDGFVK